MESNLTINVPLYCQGDMIGVYILLLLFVCVSIILSIFIVSIISFTKALRSSTNLLIINTNVATVLFVTMNTINISYFFRETVVSDWQCRVQAYFGYVFLHKVSYSYLLQGISRLLFTITPRHRRILSCRVHLIFILVETFATFAFPLPTLITTDVVYRASAICLIPMARVLHVIYFYSTSYFIPLFSVIAVYWLIRYQVKSSTRTVQNPSHSSKRDIELTRNILILFSIFLFAGVPSVIYIFLYKILKQDLLSIYMFTASATCISTALEKISLLLINRDLRRETRKILSTYLLCYPPNQIDIQPLSLQRMSIQLPKRASIHVIQRRFN